MKKVYTFFTALFFVSIASAQDTELSTSLQEETKITDFGLYFDGVQGVNYEFGPRITPHGDCIDVVNGYVFVTWYRGGMDDRHVMLSRKELGNPSANWVTIEFPHQHIGFQGNPAIGDSHNTIAVGVCELDGTIHLLYDMHAYGPAAYPDDYFNYSVTYANKAFVPDNEFNISIFKPKQNYINPNYANPELVYNGVTYPLFDRAADGRMLVRYRRGGSGSGNTAIAFYNGSTWTNHWTYSIGALSASSDRYSMYGGEKFLNGNFYSGFSVRYLEPRGYRLNSGLYFAYTDDVPTSATSSTWYDAFDNAISVPIQNPDLVKIGEPGDDYGTTTEPRTPDDPAFTVTQSGAIHFVARVDNTNVHYYKGPTDLQFSSAGGGLIPDPDTRGDIFSYNDHVFMVELIGGKPNIKVTKEGTNNWYTAYQSSDAKSFMHFDAYVVGDKLYVYLMQSGSGDARPLYLQIYNLTETINGVSSIIIEAEQYTTASPEVVVENNDFASNGQIVGTFPGNKFLEYKFNATAPGLYDFSLFASNQNRDDSLMDIVINGVSYNNTPITRSFSWDAFFESKIVGVNLIAGENVVRLTQKLSLSSRPDKLEFKFAQALSTKTFENNKITLYPNPSTGVFNIKTNFQHLNYELISLQGQVVEVGTIKFNQLNFSKYSKGVYFLRMSSDNNLITKQILIK